MSKSFKIKINLEKHWKNFRLNLNEPDDENICFQKTVQNENVSGVSLNLI